MDIKTKADKIRRAGELEGWLLDAAWEDNIHKPLLHYREGLVRGLVGSILGNPYEVRTVEGVKCVSPEALAGRIHGIDWVLNHIVKVLKEGYTAEEALKKGGFFDAPPTFNAGGNNASS